MEGVAAWAGCSGWSPRPPRYRAAPGKRWASQQGDPDTASGLAAPDGGGLTGDPCVQPGEELRPLPAPFAGPDGKARPRVHQPCQDKARLEGGGARWHLPGWERLGGSGRRAGGPVGQAHAPPACLEPRHTHDGHLGRRSGGRAREPQLPPWEHLRAALPAERRPRAQLQTEGGWGGGTLHSLVIREASTRQTGRHALLALK